MAKCHLFIYKNIVCKLVLDKNLAEILLIQILDWDRQKNVAVFNWLMGAQPSDYN
jgi:hypothetical protein